MKHLSFFIIALLVYATTTYGQNREINFEKGAWEEVLEKAKKENKLIFMDAYASWCGPCKWMAKNTFKNDTIADFYNVQFVNYKLDMEKGQGPELAKKYKVSAYPNLLYINASGELMHRSCGALGTTEFLKLGKEAQNPETQFATLTKRYESESGKPEFLKKYLAVLSSSCLKTDEVASQYFSTQKESEMLNENNWKMIQEYPGKTDSWEFGFVENHFQDYVSRFGKEEVESYISGVYSKELYKLLQKNDKDGYNNLKIRVQKSELSNKNLVLKSIEMERYFSEANYTQFAQAALEVLAMKKGNEPEMINNIGWNFYEHVTDTKYLQELLPYMEEACQKQANYAFYDTYAALLTKTKNPKAKEWIDKAVKQGKKEGADVSETEKLKQKLK